MTRNQLHDVLCKLLDTEIKSLIFKLGVPTSVLPSNYAPQADRVIAVLTWAEPRGRIPEVELLYRELLDARGDDVLSMDALQKKLLQEALRGLSEESLRFLRDVVEAERNGQPLILRASFIRSSRSNATAEDRQLHSILRDLRERGIIRPDEHGPWRAGKHVVIVASFRQLLTLEAFLWEPTTPALMTRPSGEVEAKPFVVFEYDKRDGWRIRNLGPGGASDILVAEKISRNGDWHRPVRIRPLAEGEHRALTWVGHRNVDVLGIRYINSTGKISCVVCLDDRSQVSFAETFPNWHEQEIQRDWSQ